MLGLRYHAGVGASFSQDPLEEVFEEVEEYDAANKIEEVTIRRLSLTPEEDVPLGFDSSIFRPRHAIKNGLRRCVFFVCVCASAYLLQLVFLKQTFWAGGGSCDQSTLLHPQTTCLIRSQKRRWRI